MHAHSSGQYVDGLRAPVLVHRSSSFTSSPTASNFSLTPPSVSSGSGNGKAVGEAYAYDEEFTGI